MRRSRANVGDPSVGQVPVLAQTPRCVGPGHLFSIAAPTVSATGLPGVVGAGPGPGTGAGHSGPGRAVGTNSRVPDPGLGLWTRANAVGAVPVSVSAGSAGDADAVSIVPGPHKTNTVANAVRAGICGRGGKDGKVSVNA
jgi:hypothetical protein